MATPSREHGSLHMDSCGDVITTGKFRLGLPSVSTRPAGGHQVCGFAIYLGMTCR